MERRKFFKDTGMIAIGIGVFGKVAWSNDRFIGDNPTTTDVLGPFYRPGAPVRTNINSKEYTGKLFHISGTVFKEDGKTPFKNCQLEIWQCDEHEVYDNTSDEYKYRGLQKTGADGKYHFIGMHPIPYPIAPGSPVYRPAHIHLLVSGKGQQDLITQIYLEGDPYLQKDIGSMSPQAVQRILKIGRSGDNEEAVRFDIVMAKEFKVDDTVFGKLVGLYVMNDKSIIEFYKRDDLLYLKTNGQIREALSYKGDNTFAGGANNSTVAKFQLQMNGDVNVKMHVKNIAMGEFDLEGSRVFNYK